MRSKLSAALLLGLMVAGAAWASNKPTAKPEPVSPEGLGCCVTGDCCCPGQGSCCDPNAKAKAATAPKAAKKGFGCCVTGNCCCPGQGACCAAAKVNAEAKGCCGTAAKPAAKACCGSKAKTEAKACCAKCGPLKQEK